MDAGYAWMPTRQVVHRRLYVKVSDYGEHHYGARHLVPGGSQSDRDNWLQFGSMSRTASYT